MLIYRFMNFKKVMKLPQYFFDILNKANEKIRKNL